MTLEVYNSSYMALVSTPSAQSFDFNSLIPIVQWAQPYLVGAVGGIGTMYFSGYVREYFDERARKAKHKRNVAREVHQLVNEANTGNFRIPARSQEHVNSVLTDLDGVDRHMGKTLNRFVALWGLLVPELQKDKAKERKEEYDYLMGMLHEVEEKRKILAEWANRIRVGSKARG